MTNQDLQILKNKFDIIGNDPALNRALEVAVSVAPTDISVLVTGESGVGKENIPRIIHQNSPRKRGKCAGDILRRRTAERSSLMK